MNIPPIESFHTSFVMKNLGAKWSIQTHQLPEQPPEPSQFRLENPLHPNEESIPGTEYLHRICAVSTPLNAEILESLRNKKVTDYTTESFLHDEHIPKTWTKNPARVHRIFFPGTIIIDPEGFEGMLYFAWQGWENKNRGFSRWGYRLLVYPFYPTDLSAVL